VFLIDGSYTIELQLRACGAVLRPVKPFHALPSHSYNVESEHAMMSFLRSLSYAPFDVPHAAGPFVSESRDHSPFLNCQNSAPIAASFWPPKSQISLSSGFVTNEKSDRGGGVFSSGGADQ